MNILEMEKTILALQAEVGAISKANYQLNDKISSIKSSFLENKNKEDSVSDKTKLCRAIIFNIESLKMDLEKELRYVAMGDHFYSEYCDYKDSLESIDYQLKELFDEEDE